MLRTDIERLRDMRIAARNAMRYCQRVSREQFALDTQVQDATVRCVAVIGEAATRIGDATKRSVPQIPWSQVANMRHRLIHDYFAINLEIVWRTIHDDLPPLVTAIEAHLMALGVGFDDPSPPG